MNILDRKKDLTVLETILAYTEEIRYYNSIDQGGSAEVAIDALEIFIREEFPE